MNKNAKYLTQGGQMTAYRWRMFLQVNNWIGFWVAILFLLLAGALFFILTPKETLDNGLWYWYASLNHSFIQLMSPGAGRFYTITYWYAPTATTYHLKMTLEQMLTDPYMQAMGARLYGHLKTSALAAGVFCATVYGLVAWYVTAVGRRESEDEFISGMKLTDNPGETNRLLRKNGELSDLRIGDLHMVRNAEVMNFLMHGTIGVGKSTLIRWLLDWIRKRGDRAIIYDSGCSFTQTHYRPETDRIMNPFDARCVRWDMWGECEDSADYQNLATSLIPEEGESDPFWVASSRTIFADLAIRMSAEPDRSIEKFLKTLLSLSMKSLRDYLANTPAANLVEEKIEKTAISIRSVVTNYAKSLRYLQGLDEKGGEPFTIRHWMTSPEYDNSWLFISTKSRHRPSIRPLISMWVSLATLFLQSMDEDPDRRVWFILDETPSLQRIPDLPGTLAEARKFGGCFVIGAQNMPQLVHVYGQQLARSIFDLLNTRAYGRSPSAEVAEMVEKELGHQRRKEAREQNSYGLDQVRDGVSLGKDKVNNPVVDYEQIMSLSNLQFYVRLPGDYPVTHLKLKYRKPKVLQPGFISRDFHDVLSPELEKLIRKNEQASRAGGLTFPEAETVPVSEVTGSPLTPEPERKEDTQAGPVVPVAARHPVVRPSLTVVPGGAAVNDPAVPLSPGSSGPATVRPNTVSPTGKTPVPPRQNRQTPPFPAPEHREGQVRAAEESVLTGGALDLLNRRARKRPSGNSGDPEGDDTGAQDPENLSLDMKLETLPDGQLQVTTAGKTPARTTDDTPGPKGAGKQMLDDEQTILRHREAQYEQYRSQQDGRDDMEHDL
ncbi:type IV conjugative transfer system coupling protein TraD [Mangrovibacter phragmitis]|uniref:type IV conjugative transfer system coupling protein TraD n=1 Tax=Mangrovibacter phragmitis TaxID=1691903 RepID=UPI003516E5AB